MFFRENSSLPNDKWVVPHSELGMHTGAAGRPALVIACSKSACAVVFERKDGACGRVEGLPREVVDAQLLAEYQQVYGKPATGKE